jgi:hypothetical protein
MFQPATALPGRPLRAAVLDDWNIPQIPADDFLTGALSPPDLGPVRKLAAEMTALALTDAGLRDVAGTCRTGLIIDDARRVRTVRPGAAPGVPAGPGRSRGRSADRGQGIGTAAGDTAELAALTQLRRGGQDRGTVAALGAISACVGYARAAGIAGLVKAAVAMAAGTIPPGPGCSRPHPLIASGEALLRLPARPEPWPDGAPGPSGARRPRLAAVNSLGTADPAVLAGHQGLRDAEGIHLVLRREAETDRWARRRRRRADRPGDADQAGVADRAGGADPASGADAAGGARVENAGAEARGPVMEVREAGAGVRGAGAGVRGTGVVAVREGGERPRVFVLRGGDPGTLAGELDVIAASADRRRAACPGCGARRKPARPGRPWPQGR